MAIEENLIITGKEAENAIVVAVFDKYGDREMSREFLEELELLADTAGANVIDKFHQELEKPNVATYIGKGKLEEIKLFVEENDIKLALFDDELSPVQIRNLERQLNVKVLDRSGLILDIFATRAKTREAKTQVELAQLQYMKPRLTRMWTHLSKQHGGIGTRGPGETQIEVDRRLINKRIEKLKDKLDEIEVQSEQQRKQRDSLPTFSLVGYTNAGKSTLMTAITESDAYVENKLFATLDTTTRSFELPGGQKALLSDTVGFIRKLPSHLIASFRSTLAEARESDFIVHVIDISHKYFREHIETVEKTLELLDIKNKPIIMVFNKIDLLEEPEMINLFKEEFPGSIFISATKNMNISALMDKFQEMFDRSSKKFELFIPYEKAYVGSQLYQFAEVDDKKSDDHGTHYKIKVQNEEVFHFKNKFGEFVLSN